MADKKDIDINIKGDSRSYRTAAGEAKNLTRDLTQEMELAYRAGAHLGDGIKAFAKTATVAMTAAGAATLYLTKQVVDQADGFKDLSKKTGQNIEDIGAWSVVTEKSGTSIEQLALGLKFTSKYMVEHGDNLKTLGIEGKTSSEVMIKLAGIIASLPEDDPRRVALSMEVLGKSAAELLPLLSEGEEGLRKMVERGRELNPITAEFAEQADQVNDQLVELETTGKKLGVSIASELLPSVLDITKAMTLAAQEGGLLEAVWVGMGGVAANALGLDEMSQAKDRLASVNREIQDVLGHLNGGGGIRTASGIRGLTEQDKQEMLQRLKELGIEAANLQRAINPEKAAAEGPVKPANTKAIDKVLGGSSKKTGSGGGTSIYAQEQKELASLILEIEKAGSVDKTHNQILQEKVDAYATLDPALKAYLNTQLQQINNAELITAHEAAVNQGIENEIELQNERYEAEKAGQEAREQSFAEMAEALKRENEDLNIDLISSDKARAAAQLEIEHQRRIERINALALEGEEARELIDQETENYKLRVKDMEQSTKKSTSAAKEFGLVFQSATEDAVVGGEKLSDVLDGLYKDLLRLATRKLVTEPLLENIGGIFEGFDLGSIFGGSNGTITNFMDGKAITGSVFDNLNSFDIGTKYVTHDQVAKIHKGEEIVPAGQVSRGNGDVSVSITINADGSRSENSNGKGPDLNNMASQLEAAVGNIVLKFMRPGNILARS